MGFETPNAWVGIMVIVGLVLLAFTIYSNMNEKPMDLSGIDSDDDDYYELDEDEDDEEEDEDEDEDGKVEPAIIRAISSARNAKELMDVVRMMDDRDETLFGEENTVFLRQALVFKEGLSIVDWELIRDVAGEDSKLEEEAESRI